MRRPANWLVAIALVVGACNFGKSADLTKLVLTASQVSGAGGEPVSISAGPSSRALGGPSGATLDQCAPSFPSEALRKARYQVAYVDVTGRIIASNEVVRYKPDGATQSYRELTAALQHCAPQNGATEFATATSDPSLLARQAAFTFRVPQAGAPVYEAAIYQYRNDALDVTYAFRATSADALNAARAMARLAVARVKAA